MGLLEVCKGEIILGELTQIHYQLAWHIELYTSPQSLLVPLADHIQQHFELGGALFRAEPGIVCRWTG